MSGNRVFTQSLQAVGSSLSLRSTAKVLRPQQQLTAKRLLGRESVSLHRLISKPIRRGVRPDYKKDGEVLVIKTLEMRDGYIDLSNAQRVSREFYDAHPKARIRFGDILISSTGEGRGKVDFYDLQEPAIADSHVAVVSVRPEFDPWFVYLFLKGQVGKAQLSTIEVAVKGTPEIYSDDIAKLRIVLPDREKRTSIMTEVRVLEEAISKSRDALQSSSDVINAVICREFQYPLAEYQSRQRERTFTRTTLDFAKSWGLRCSSKFHHPDYELTDKFFAGIRHKRIKAFLAAPIRLGATLDPELLDDDGPALYVTPGAIRREDAIEPKNCARISQEFYDRTKHRFGLRKHDILIARSGEGTIGKVGLFDLMESAIFSDFTMRVRFDASVYAPFAWYYFRSIPFQTQVEREKRGMGNMTNIFPSQIERLLIVDCELQKQKEIASEIASEIAKVVGARNDIESRSSSVADLLNGI